MRRSFFEGSSEMNEILSNWSLGEVHSVVGINTGLVNETFIVSAAVGKFVLQRLGGVFNSPQVVVDQAVIVQYLKLDYMPVPQIILTNQGLPYYQATEGIYKLSQYIDHQPNPRARMGEIMVSNGFTVLAELHIALSKLPYVPKFSIPNFHNTPYYLEELSLRMSNPQNSRRSQAVSEVYDYLAKTLPQYSLSDYKDRQIIHGDPKLENFLIKGSWVEGVIDLDTFMVASVIVDIGDALRSWMKQSDGTFNHHMAMYAISRYRNVNKMMPYTDTDILRATKLMSLELATRYLIDYFDESYFSWDRARFASSSEHNLQRCKAMIKYADSIC